MVTVHLTGCCTPRTVLLMVTVQLTQHSARTDCPIDGDCAVNTTYNPRTVLLMVTVRLTGRTILELTVLL